MKNLFFRKRNAFSFIEFIIYGVLLAFSLKLGLYFYKSFTDHSSHMKLISSIALKNNLEDKCYTLIINEHGIINIVFKDSYKDKIPSVLSQLKEAFRDSYEIKHSGDTVTLAPIE